MKKESEPPSIHDTESQFGVIYPQGFKVEDSSTRRMREDLEKWEDSLGLPKNRIRRFVEKCEQITTDQERQ